MLARVESIALHGHTHLLVAGWAWGSLGKVDDVWTEIDDDELRLHVVCGSALMAQGRADFAVVLDIPTEVASVSFGPDRDVLWTRGTGVVPILPTPARGGGE